ncbi:TPA: hypothetical protein DEP96_01875 [Candidatus Uhrbacteria bacterium]|nr:hypothetical protein [Candidatus Uhrbacteria bacterium]
MNIFRNMVTMALVGFLVPESEVDPQPDENDPEPDDDRYGSVPDIDRCDQMPIFNFYTAYFPMSSFDFGYGREESRDYLTWAASCIPRPR